jgi:hypothetical protein
MRLPLVFHPPLRRAVSALLVAGVGLAGFTAPLAWRRTGVASALPFIAVAVAGTILARAVLRSARWALVLSTVLLGAQLGGVVGSAWELAHGVNGSKSRELRRLGFDPEFGVSLNLAYSVVAFAVFGWVAARWLGTRARWGGDGSRTTRRRR